VNQLVRDTANVMQVRTIRTGLPMPLFLARDLSRIPTVPRQEFTQSGGVRPFGLSLLVAGYDDDGPQLYQVGCICAE
jgi:20S proteasome alpha/beta subunit